MAGGRRLSLGLSALLLVLACEASSPAYEACVAEAKHWEDTEYCFRAVSTEGNSLHKAGAMSLCAEHGGVFASPYDNESYVGMRDGAFQEKTHINVYRRGDDSFGVALPDGSIVDVWDGFPWMGGEPNNWFGNEPTVEMSPQNDWKANDIAEGNKPAVLCAFPKHPYARCAKRTSSVKSGGKCYDFTAYSGDWRDAAYSNGAEECRRAGGQLAVLDTAEVLNAVKDTVLPACQAAVGTCAYVRLSGSREPGTPVQGPFHWHHPDGSTTPVGDDHFAPGEPGGATEIHLALGFQGLNDFENSWPDLRTLCSFDSIQHCLSAPGSFAQGSYCFAGAETNLGPVGLGRETCERLGGNLAASADPGVYSRIAFYKTVTKTATSTGGYYTFALQLDLAREVGGALQWTHPNGSRSDFNASDIGVAWAEDRPKYNAGFVTLTKYGKLVDQKSDLTTPLSLDFPRNSLCMWEGFCAYEPNLDIFLNATLESTSRAKTKLGYEIGTEATIGCRPGFPSFTLTCDWPAAFDGAPGWSSGLLLGHELAGCELSRPDERSFAEQCGGRDGALEVDGYCLAPISAEGIGSHEDGRAACGAQGGFLPPASKAFRAAVASLLPLDNRWGLSQASVERAPGEAWAAVYPDARREPIPNTAWSSNRPRQWSALIVPIARLYASVNFDGVQLVDTKSNYRQPAPSDRSERNTALCAVPNEAAVGERFRPDSGDAHSDCPSDVPPAQAASIGGFCYWSEEAAEMSFEQALEACEAKAGQLALVAARDVQDALSFKFARQGRQLFFTAHHRSAEEGPWEAGACGESLPYVPFGKGLGSGCGLLSFTGQGIVGWPCGESIDARPLCMKRTAKTVYGQAEGLAAKATEELVISTEAASSDYDCGIQCGELELCLAYEIDENIASCKLLKAKPRDRPDLFRSSTSDVKLRVRKF